MTHYSGERKKGNGMKIGCFTLVLAIILTVVLMGTAMAFADTPISLTLNGAAVPLDPLAPPIIESSRTLVPYRALLEAMGAKVLWDQEAMMATAVLGSNQVQVTIDNAVGFVNGAAKNMDVPPRIVNNRTMIPLRFVMENLNCTVGWDEKTRTVSVATGKVDSLTKILSIALEETPTSYRIVATGDNNIYGTGTFAYEGPERFGIDIKNATFIQGVGKIAADNEYMTGVRYSQFNENTVRIVVDLKGKTAGKVSLSTDRKTVYLDFDKPDVTTDPGNPTDPGIPADPVDRGDTDGRDTRTIPVLDWRATGKLIVVDVGHGGRDPGAEGKLDGVHKIWEKDLNLAIALRLREILTAAGANIVLLRDTDAPMTLYARPEAANTLNADMLISIHNNSNETSTPHGTEVLYYTKEWEAGYGVSSKDLAAAIQKEMIAEIGFFDRGIKNKPEYAVLNKSLMPAVIIEGGHLSNPGNLTVMLTDAYVEGYAVAVARGVINALNTSVMGEQ